MGTFIGFLPSVAHFVASQGIMVRRGIAAYVTPKITTTNLELLKSFTSSSSKAKKYQHLQPIYFYIKNNSKDFFLRCSPHYPNKIHLNILSN